MNLLPARVEAGTARAGALDAPAAGVADGTAVLLGIRPHDVVLSAPTPPDPGHPVAGVEHLGSECHVALDVQGLRLRATLAAECRPAPGERWRVQLPASRVHLFDATTGVRLGPGKAVPAARQR
jgi:multiple sugar transport system ATP-binding protein